MEEENSVKETGTKLTAIYVLAIIAIGLLAFNQYQLSALTGGVAAGSSTGAVVSTGDPVQDAVNAVIPTGKPAVYGDELKVTFDSPQDSLNILADLESQISYSDLTSSQQKRYTELAKTEHSACEFCCGVGSGGFGFRSGTQSDCGCAHNLAFSGLTKYLLKNHENEYTNQDIFNEIQKWKGLFFPKQMVAAYLQEQANSGELSDTSVLSQLPGMVGGC